MQRPLSRWVWGFGLAFCAALGVGVVRLRARTPAPPPSEPVVAAPAPSVLSEASCQELGTRYLRLADTLRACTQDDECVAEPRGPQFAALDGCPRYRRRDASTAELEPLEQRWLQSACVSSFVTTCEARPVQCLAGRCVERPPEPIPRDWKRHDAQNVFTFFAPPALEDQKMMGTDSLANDLAGPPGLLSYEYGPYTRTLEGKDTPAGYGKTTRAEVMLLAGQKARFVSYRGPKNEALVGVYFPTVPKPSWPRPGTGEGESSLRLSLTCKGDCEATFLMVAHSLEFY